MNEWLSPSNDLLCYVSWKIKFQKTFHRNKKRIQKTKEHQDNSSNNSNIITYIKSSGYKVRESPTYFIPSLINETASDFLDTSMGN